MEPAEGDALAKWAAGRFSNCLFGMYEQIGPHDPFGRFMRRHFVQRQCPLRSLLTRPDLEAQRARFASFHRVDAADMTATLSATPVDELKRVAGLEPFDEYEEFHLKCTHYFCLAAMTGQCTRAKKIWSKVETSPAVQHTVSVHRLRDRSISRFGLTASYAGGHLVVCGGHGTYDAFASEAHGRQTSVLYRSLDPKRWHTEQAFQQIGEHKAAMYCSSTTVGSKVILFGGRLGPHQPTNALAICSWIGDGVSQQPQLEVMEGMSLWPPARWRHSATLVSIEGKDQVLILGGRGADEAIFSFDVAWLLDARQLTWRCCRICPASDGSYPCPRHSHSAASLGSDSDLLMICGGLDEDEKLLGDAWILQRDESKGAGDALLWRKAISPLPRPRSGIQPSGIA